MRSTREMREVGRAEHALHRRAALACGAALSAGVPGRFRTWSDRGAMAVLASAPALEFLSTVTGVTGETVDAAIELVVGPDWHGVAPTLVVSTELDHVDEHRLLDAGLSRAADRTLATARLDDRRGLAEDREVIDAGADASFVEVLLAGYEIDGVVAAFLSAEHRLPAMRRFLLCERGVSIAAAAMTIHGAVAVLGGASALPAHRGEGAQSRLLAHRLAVAARAGCDLAVATARPDSVSAANLCRAGFRLHRRSAWIQASPGALRPRRGR